MTRAIPATKAFKARKVTRAILVTKVFKAIKVKKAMLEQIVPLTEKEISLPLVVEKRTQSWMLMK